MPPQEWEGTTPLADKDRGLIMNIFIPIEVGQFLVGTYAPESLGFNLNQGNNIQISLHLDSKKQSVPLERFQKAE